MKKFFLFLWLALPVKASAQDVYKLVAQETCDCITKKDLSSATKKSIELSLGLCMLESIQKNNIDVEVSDGVAMRGFGEKVGLQMAPLCPNVFSFLTRDETEQRENSLQFFTVSGKIKSIDESDFLFLNLREESGKETRLIWLQYFKGSDDYIAEPRKIVGKKVSVKYQPIECYLPKAKGYYSYKQIIELPVD